MEYGSTRTDFLNTQGVQQLEELLHLSFLKVNRVPSAHHSIETEIQNLQRKSAALKKQDSTLEKEEAQIISKLSLKRKRVTVTRKGLSE